MVPSKKAINPKVDEPELLRVRTLHPVRHNGTDYPEQILVELPELDATALVDGGWAELARDDPAELSLTPK